MMLKDGRGIPLDKVLDVDVYPRVSFGQDIIQDVTNAHIANRKIKFDHL